MAKTRSGKVTQRMSPVRKASSNKRAAKTAKRKSTKPRTKFFPCTFGPKKQYKGKNNFQRCPENAAQRAERQWGYRQPNYVKAKDAGQLY